MNTKAQTPRAPLGAVHQGEEVKERKVRYATVAQTRRAGARVMKKYFSVFKRLAE